MHLQTLERLDLKQLAHYLEKLGSSSILHRLNEHGANLDVQAFSSERNMLRIRLRNLQTAMKHDLAVSGDHYTELTMRLGSYTAAAARLAVLFIFAARVGHTPQRTRLISDYLTAVKPLIEHWRHEPVEQSLQLIENAGLALQQLGIKKRFDQYAQFDAAVRRARRLPRWVSEKQRSPDRRLASATHTRSGNEIYLTGGPSTLHRGTIFAPRTNAL